MVHGDLSDRDVRRTVHDACDRQVGEDQQRMTLSARNMPWAVRWAK